MTVTVAEINERRAELIAHWAGKDWNNMNDAERRPYRVQAALMPGDTGWDAYAGSPLQRRVRQEQDA